MQTDEHQGRRLKVLSSTGNLGDTPIEEGSFYLGMQHKPDYLAADAGSSDLGPTFLGADSAHNPPEWEYHDLELLVMAARERGIPVFIGSCGSTGSNRGVDLFLEFVRDIASRHGLDPFTVGTIHSQVELDLLRQRMKVESLPPLEGDDCLSEDDLSVTDHAVAMMGVEQLMHSFNHGADVVLAGRCCDDAVYAAYPISLGFSRALSLHLGKAIECASLVGFPQKIKESVLGTITDNAVLLEPMHPDQSITPLSAAAHSMYERVDPFTQAVPGGMLDLRDTVYEAYTDRICRLSGTRYIPAADGKYRVKIEGAGFVGHRVFHMVGIRDPIALMHLDKICGDVRSKVSSVFSPQSREGEYQLCFHVYGRDAVMGLLEPVKDACPHEVGILIEVIADTEELATSIAKLAKFRFFYAEYPGQKNSSGGGAAIVVDEPLYPRNKAYRWTIDHLLPLDDPLDPDVFTFRYTRVGRGT